MPPPMAHAASSAYQLVDLLESSPLMQTMKGKAARGPTAQEFAHVLRTMKPQIDAVVQKYKRGFAYGGALLSYDHEAIQDAVDPEDCGYDPDCRIPLPPLSPDCHKVIEHVHAQIKPKSGVCLKSKISGTMWRSIVIC
jgi:hypothetical protein